MAHINVSQYITFLILFAVLIIYFSLISDFLYPKGALQERVLSLLVPLCAGGIEFVGMLERYANEHLERLEVSGSGHFLSDLPL